MARVPSSPARRTYQTGSNLPALTTEWRPIPLGRDEQGEPDGQIRALAVLLRNRADSSVYIREGPDADDAFEIAPGEDYRIWESNGINDLNLKGEVGGETVEVRTLEAHNDFDLTDKIDAFARSIAHFISTATTSTTISGADIDVPVSIDAQTANLSTDANITGSDVTLSTSVDAATATIPTSIDAQNIAALDMNLTGSNVEQDVDISTQSVGDINVMDIEGTPVKRYFYGNLHTPAGTTTEWDIEVPATEDGFIQFIGVRFFENDEVFELDEMGVRLMINGTNVLPREHRATRNIAEFSRAGRSADIQRYDEKNECNFVIEPLVPYKFRQGDNVQIRAAQEREVWGPPSTGETYIVEITVHYVLRQET